MKFFFTQSVLSFASYSFPLVSCPPFDDAPADRDIYFLDACMGHYTDFNFYKAVDRLIATLHQANVFFETLKPWALKKDPTKAAELDVVLHLTLETLRVCGILLQPIIPNIAACLLNKISVEKGKRCFGDVKTLSWEAGEFASRDLGREKEVLFRRILLEGERKTRRV